EISRRPDLSAKVNVFYLTPVMAIHFFFYSIEWISDCAVYGRYLRPGRAPGFILSRGAVARRSPGSWAAPAV
ncbi:hypothetical protein K5M49_26845, partial [Serratia marcescens]|nr:hypothetical protein [Serratia marcescens]